MNINYTDKDKVLDYLVNYQGMMPESVCSIDFKDMQTNTGFTPDAINAILLGIQEEDLISILILRRDCPTLDLIVHQRACDLFNRGGFTMKENLLKKEVEKLLLEIEALKPTLGDKIEKFSTIASNIMNLVKII